ncbi:MAG: PDZ domain-containing protein, partial [Proteobacteria bacterium]
SFQPNANGLAIASVEKGSVAHRAGLKAGQIITHANGTELGPKYWEHAQAFIEQAGDQVVMKLYNGATVLLVRD